jgi:trimethylamine monooxygenase
MMASFQELESQGYPIPEVVVFELQNNTGGNWNYSWRTGIDSNANPIHTGMYMHMWSKRPKETLEFPDYTFEKHFGESTCSYPPREALLDYIQGYYKHHGCNDKWVRFNTVVKNVVWDAKKNRFNLTASDSLKEYTEQFHQVIVANGHLSTPHIPVFEGMDTFQGMVLHSRDLRIPESYKGQTVVVVGKSYSAEDIASLLYKYGAKRVILTHRKGM